MLKLILRILSGHVLQHSSELMTHEVSHPYNTINHALNLCKRVSGRHEGTCGLLGSIDKQRLDRKQGHGTSPYRLPKWNFGL